MAGGQVGARRKPGFLTFPMWLPHVTGADTYENQLCPYFTVNVVPDSQRCQKMNPHLTVQHISSYRYSEKKLTLTVTPSPHVRGDNFSAPRAAGRPTKFGRPALGRWHAKLVSPSRRSHGRRRIIG